MKNAALASKVFILEFPNNFIGTRTLPMVDPTTPAIGSPNATNSNANEDTGNGKRFNTIAEDTIR